MLDPTTVKNLKKCSAATLTTQLFKRGLRRMYMQGVRPLAYSGEPMVGEAFTLRFIPAREDLDHVGVFADPEHPQRKSIETVPAGHVLVCDCRRDASAASGGSILLTRLQIRGAAGFVSDGGLRDSTSIAELKMPVYFSGPSAPLNLVRHHAVDTNVPIGCGDVPVYPGDVVFGDDEGVVVIPRNIADEVARDAAEQELLEQFVIEEVRKGAPVIGTYPPSEAVKQRYEIWRKSKS